MFPWETLGVGVAGAVLLAILRTLLSPKAPFIFSPTHKPSRWDIRDVSLLLLAVFAALALRLWNLESRVIDNDEPASFGWTDLDGWAREHDARLHPPLSPWLMSAAFGLRAILADARSVSVVAGIVVVALVFAALRDRGRTTAALTAFFAAVAPAMLHASQLARGYSLAAAALLATHVLLTRALRHSTERAWLAYTIAGTLALFTEYITLVPIVVEALVVLLAKLTPPRTRMAVLTSLGGMLAISACFVPFALSTFSLGVGGPPRDPDGVWPPLKHGLELFGGAGGAALGGVALLLALSAWWPATATDDQDALVARRASTAALLGLALLVLGGLITAMRARYVLPVFPLLAVACAAAATRVRPRGAKSPADRPVASTRVRPDSAPAVAPGASTRVGPHSAPALAPGASTRVRAHASTRVRAVFGGSAGAVLFVGHLALLPCYLRQTCAASEIGRGPPLRDTLAVLRADPRAPVVVVPSWAIAEPSYRLIHRFPGPDSRRDCPARLCVEGREPPRRAMYGLDADEFLKRFPELRTSLGQPYVLVRGPIQLELEACTRKARDTDATLYRCH